MTRLNAKWLLTSRSEGDFQEGDFNMVEEELPPMGPNELCVKVIMVSCDPTQIGWARVDAYVPRVPLGSTMMAIGVGDVVESNNENFAVGDRVFGGTGFQTYWQGVPVGSILGISKLAPGVTPESSMCIFGHIGLTAHRLLSIGEPKKSDTVVVTGAAGAVGLVVCQLAKARGCRVVGTAGSERKLEFLREKIGVDVAINYKQEALAEELKKACPDGVDIYWENVGGNTSVAVWPLLNMGARVLVCGMISMYGNNFGMSMGLPLYDAQIAFKQLRIQGFLPYSDPKDQEAAMQELGEFVMKGQLKPYIDVVKGFKKSIVALAGIFKGDNLGKRVVQYVEVDDVAKA